MSRRWYWLLFVVINSLLLIGTLRIKKIEKNRSATMLHYALSEPKSPVLHFAVQGKRILYHGTVSTVSPPHVVICINKKASGEMETSQSTVHVDDAITANKHLFDNLPFTGTCEFVDDVHAFYVSVDGILRVTRKVVPFPPSNLCVCSKLYGNASMFHTKRKSVVSWVSNWDMFGAHVALYMLGVQTPVEDMLYINDATMFTHNKSYSYHTVEGDYQHANNNCLVRSLGSCRWVLNIDVDEQLVILNDFDTFIEKYNAHESIGFRLDPRSAIRESQDLETTWKRMFQPSIYTTDTHGSNPFESAVTVDIDEAYIVHNKMSFSVENGGFQPTYVEYKMKHPSTYSASFHKWFEVATLEKWIKRRYTSRTGTQSRILFVFHPQYDEIPCEYIRQKALHSRGAKIVPSSKEWHQCKEYMTVGEEGDDPREKSWLSLPFVSHVRWTPGEVAPWVKRTVRPNFMSFVGSADMMNPMSRTIRNAVNKSCHVNPNCRSIIYPKGVIQSAPWAVSLGIKVKRQSVFCLEPQGETVARRSILDSLLSGCIPVFISYEAHEWKTLYSNFINMSKVAVYVSPADVWHLNERLSRIDAKELQRNIRRYAIGVSYSFSDYPVGDAIDTFATLMDASKPLSKKKM